MYYHTAVAQLPSQLSDGFNIGQGFNIAYCTANFCNYKIIPVVFAQQLNTMFYFVGDMRNNLNCFTQVISPALFFNYRLVNSPCSYIVGL
jgi:hypothetical protein